MDLMEFGFGNMVNWNVLP